MYKKREFIAKVYDKLKSNVYDWRYFEAGSYNPNKDYSGKYMVAFYFKDDKGIPNCHCTHKYIGEMKEKNIPKFTKIIDKFFLNVPLKNRTWVFDDFQLLGEQEDTPVMVSKITTDKLPNLKGLLDMLVQDTWPEYIPHITLSKKAEEIQEEDKKALIMNPDYYALVEGNKIIKKWRMTDE